MSYYLIWRINKLMNFKKNLMLKLFIFSKIFQIWYAIFYSINFRNKFGTPIHT